MPQVLPLSLQGRRPGRIRPELGPLRRVLGRLGDPQLAVPSILVVGTNGKGSTAAMLEALLEANGVATGLTISPHLVSVEERIRLGGEANGRTRLEEYLERLAPHDDLTFFETLTSAAFLAFAEERVDVAILEAGMGGTWDATRVARSSVVGITNVGSDHAAWLGNEPADRARDKGAPLRSAAVAVIGPGLAPELLPALDAPNAVPASEMVELDPRNDGGVRVVWGESVFEIPVPLPGAHQIDNLHLALALARGAEASGMVPWLDPDSVARGLARVRWPGRLSEVCVGGRRILVDGAHNLEGAEALAEHLRRRSERRNLLFSCLDDKPLAAMARVLEPAVDAVVVCRLDDERAMPLDRLAGAFPGAVRAQDPLAGLQLLADPVVAAGSLRLVGALLEAAEGGVDS